MAFWVSGLVQIAIFEVAFYADQLTGVLFQREEVTVTLLNDEFLLIRRETGKPSARSRDRRDS